MLLHPLIMADFELSSAGDFGLKKRRAEITVKDTRSVHSGNGASRAWSSLRKAPMDWDYDDVAEWLHEQGFEKYASIIVYKHKIDGPTLLMLSESDLREKPLELDCLGDIKRLASAISKLRAGHTLSEPLTREQSSAQFSMESGNGQTPCLENDPFVRHPSDLLVCVDYKDGVVPIASADPKVLAKTSDTAERLLGEIAADSSGEGRLKRIHLLSRDDLIRQVESPDTKLKSLIKLVIAFCYCTFSLLITAFVMVLVHDRVPDMKTYPPLPDIVLDNMPLIPWAFEVCEMIAVCLALLWFTILLFHKHRVVVMRRMFSLIGTVFLLRCVTMLITSLSVPGVHLECRSQSYGTFSARLQQAYRIWSRFGMSIQGVRSCGDYMFSGHTTAITLLNHFIIEYTPDSWHGLHTVTWVLNLFGIFFILAGHEHYSIDVFIAFYISSRMFLYYHAYAYHQFSLASSDSRMRSWFPLGWFFEAGGQGRVENDFDVPLYVPVISFPELRKYLHMESKKASVPDKKPIPKLVLDSNGSSADCSNKHLKKRRNGRK